MESVHRTAPTCDATHQTLSDASYAGIGGWSPDFRIQWRVMRADLIALGFNMKIINRFAPEPRGTE
jgi:hypothetical protein